MNNKNSCHSWPKHSQFYGCEHPSSIAAYLHSHPSPGPHVIQTHESLFDSIEQSFLFFNPEQNIYKLPSVDPWFPSPSVTLKRLKWLYNAYHCHSHDIFLCSKKSLSQKTLPDQEFQSHCIELNHNSNWPSDQTLQTLGYWPSVQVEEMGFFSRRGGILDLFSPSYSYPIRLEVIGEKITSIRFFDPQTNRSLHPVSSVTLSPALEVIFDSESRWKAIQKLKLFKQKYPKNFPDSFIKKLAQGLFFHEVSLFTPFFYDQPSQALDFFQVPFLLWVDQKSSTEKTGPESSKKLSTPTKKDLSSIPNSSDRENSESFYSSLVRQFYFKELKTVPSQIVLYPMIQDTQNIWPVQGVEKFLSWSSLNRLKSQFIFIGAPSESHKEQIQFHLNQVGFQLCITSEKERSWSQWKEEQLQDSKKIHLISSFLPYHFKISDSVFLRGDQLIGKIYSPPVKKPSFSKSNAFHFSEIKVGDLVVDRLNGVGLYRGLKMLTVNQITHEYVELEYKNQDKLYVPVSCLNRLFQFKTHLSKNVLDQLGGVQWSQKLAQTQKSIQQMVLDLLKLYSMRSKIQRPAFQPPSLDLIQFGKDFPFEETPDQLKTIQTIFKDMRRDHPMERLIIGDSGYGKTEVAMRATFKAVEDGYQVAFLAPTTILSLQHFENFKDRFSNWPIHVELINRLVSASRIKNILKDLRDQKIDILIGSHRLLSSDVQFKKLGLLIIDEEHRFGVRQKEKLKKVKLNMDCIYMSATPIPRTLNMSLSGAKDISVLSTAPKNRISPQVFVFSFQLEKIKRAIEQEIQRGGQVIFVHNRVRSLNMMYDKLKDLLPSVQICMAHGQMEEKKLESSVLKFFNHQCDLLLCTTIVETGMDFQRANTIIVNDAHRLGLSQLYQLRGRVGRRAHIQSYCYFIIPEHLISEPSVVERFNFLQTHNKYNSGYQIARYDLERRGGGEFLGARQSGHIQNIGYDLYLEMLENSLHPQDVHFESEVKLPWPAYIPADYIPHDKVRLMYYKHLCDLQDMSKLEELELEWRDSFGRIPQEVKNLLGQVLIQNQCQKLKIKELKVLGNHLHLINLEKQPSKKKISLPEKFSWIHIYDYLKEESDKLG